MSSSGSNGSTTDTITPTETRKKTRLRRPPLYRVLFHNDDFTPRQFVVQVLATVFRLNEVEAQAKMMQVHNHGVGMIGVYTFEIAETKVATVMRLADEAQFPLLCTMEPEDDGQDA